jgi:tetratricopeptide (TPR) repeat protein
VIVGELRRCPLKAAPYVGLALAAALGVNSNAYNIAQNAYARPNYELGLISRREGKVEECLSYLERSRTERPDDPDPPFQEGVTLAGSGRYADAAEAFQESARREPGYVLTWFNLGLCLSRVEQYDRAAEAYERALKIERAYWEAWMGLGEAAEREGRHLGEETSGAGADDRAGRLERALDAYREAELVARHSGEAALARLGRGRVEWAAGRYENSLQHLDAAIAMDPELLDARIVKIRILKQMGLLLKAREEAARAADLAPSDQRVRALSKELKE